MQYKYDWACYTDRIKKISLSISFLFHITAFFLIFVSFPNQKNKKLEKEVFIVKLVNIPQIEIPNITEENKIKNKGKTTLPLKNGKSEKKKEILETFSSDEYKKKLFSKISEKGSMSNYKTSSDGLNIKIPEIKSVKINPPVFQSDFYTTSFTHEIPSWYINLIKKKIEENWLLKEYLLNMSAIVSFRIYRNGKVENIIIEKSSGNRNFDNSIVDAIKSVKVWPEFPENIKDKYLDIIIEFKTEG
ncbi:MAG: energy transducer TonB [Candidatus Ratteibacteria bacterium]